MGASSAIIAMVDINHTAGITGSVYATEMDIDVATLSMSAGADITGNVDFSADGVLALGSSAVSVAKRIARKLLNDEEAFAIKYPQKIYGYTLRLHVTSLRDLILYLALNTNGHK